MNNAALLYALVQNALDGIITIDEKGIIESINPAGCILFDYLEEEVIGQNISMLMPSDDRRRHDNYLEKYKNTKKPSIIGTGRELIGLRKGGQRFPMKLGVSEVQFSGKTMYAGFIHDLSKQKMDEERFKNYATELEELVEVRTKSLNDTIDALEKAKEKVSISLVKEKELSRLKNRFLSMASHEFRTPLSTVQLSASLIEKYAESFQSEPINKHVNKIKNSVMNLTAILNDFLYVEKLEVGKMMVSFSSFDLMKFSKELTEEMQLLAKASQNINYKHIGDQTMVSLDANLLKNCAINLITNAIKYSGDICSIDFTTEIYNSECILSVHDNGIGIPLEEQKYLFQAFFRAHNTGSIPGTGLGLNIVSRYVSLMKGTAKFTSNAQDGTTFILKFPIS
ncbi:PAS domain-containing sensor histidine kinase [Flavobacterium sp. PL002]|uniref:PAS domain-containing sensor histidine kinase n=1 Tax=Flavobacterium sp. PL002 TaxID=1897058 RepID=UPI0017879864|nr:PAS domain-containing sensor histidine kinase [Flavobacterium sp. PL002]MBE0391889.1 Sensor protein FixL [Flavobacterium sp. PL002]